jgi:hypothetical protein
MIWEPIQTAPKNGSSILIYVAGIDQIFISKFLKSGKNDEGFWFIGGEYCPNPTNWMPLPEKPI